MHSLEVIQSIHNSKTALDMHANGCNRSSRQQLTEPPSAAASSRVMALAALAAAKQSRGSGKQQLATG